MTQSQHDEADQLLMGRSGPAFVGFGTDPVVGQYIEGVVVDKKTRHQTVFQTKQQRDMGLPAEYEYFIGKAKHRSTKAEAEFLLERPDARAIKELVLHLQTPLRDPAKDGDDGVRTFTFPYRARGDLADALRAQGVSGGLALGSFVRVTLSALVPVEGLPTKKREYKVEVWSPGEQPTPPPPGSTHVPVKAPVQQPVAQQPVYPQYQAPVAPPPQYQAPAQPQQQQYPDQMLQMMKEQGWPAPPGYSW